MLANTSDIHAFSVAQHRHADELASIAADLSAARVGVDGFGPVGAGFLKALNEALTQEARRATELAGRLSAATSVARTAAAAYDTAEGHAGRAISVLGT